MKDWKPYKLEEVCKKITSGGTPLTSKKEFYENGTIPWLKTTEVNKGIIREIDTFITAEGLKNSSAKLIPENSIIVAMYGDGGTAGKAALTKIPLTTNQACCNLIIDEEKADYSFIFYYLKVNYENLVNLKSGGSQQNLNALTIRKFPVLLPKLSIQQRISSILNTYDELIEANNQRIKLLEETACEIYKEWFVRMRFPGYKQAKFAKGVPEGVGEIKYFKNFIKLNRGFDLPEDKIKEGQYPVVASTTIKAYHNQFKVKAPIITTGRSGSLGTVLYVNDDGWPLNTSLYVKDFKGNQPLYIFYTLKSIDFESFNSGAGVPTLNQNHLHKLKIWIAGESLQKQFKQMIEPMFKQVEILNKQNTHLRQIRDRLLPRLISGKLEVQINKQMK